MQNTSHAVMAQRIEPINSLDDFPTPPWATRALMEHVIADRGPFHNLTCLEPACGAGHMAKPLGEYFGHVTSADVHPYGYGSVVDFLTSPVEANSVDWIVTNSPFRLAEDFIKRALVMSRRGVAILARATFLESVGRYREIFRPNPPRKYAPFVERVPMVKGRLDAKASTATGYAWFVWERPGSGTTSVNWIPPCRKQLERQDDYPADI